MKKIYIIGAGGFGRELYHWLKQEDILDVNQFIGFLDDNPKALAGKAYSFGVVGSIRDHVVDPEAAYYCGIGVPLIKKRVCDRLLEQGAYFPSFVHSSAVVGGNVEIGQGSVLAPNSTVSADIRIGDFVLVNYNSSVGHDAVIGSWATLSPHCDITGYGVIGEQVFMGTHSCIVPSIKIGARATVGAGAVVTKNVANEMTVAGVPAKSLG